jgi:lipoprotein-anchoring transpeptidase ErfK/SrfK
VASVSCEQSRPRVGLTRKLAAVLGSAALLTGFSGVGAGPSAVAAVPQPVLPAVTEISPAPGQTVGVAHPVTVTFTAPVADRQAAQGSLRVTPADRSAPADGTFAWLDARTVQWTPREFFPAHTPIDVSAGGLSTRFQTGSSVVGVADLSAHTFTVSIDGVVAREMPASMGKPKFPTPIGQFTALEKQRNVTFDSRTIGIPLDSSEGYLIKGEYAVRVTWGGVYVHSAPWSVGSQGNANVSHGCINLSPDNAAWYFDTVSVGDPIVTQA